MNDIALNKKVGIERCIKQIAAYYARKANLPFEEDYLTQDAIAMNLQRACELAIDLANHAIRVKKLGLPQDSGHSFELLYEAGLIDKAMTAKLKTMVGFRNVLVHQYQRLDLDIMKRIIQQDVNDLLHFADRLCKQLS